MIMAKMTYVQLVEKFSKEKTVKEQAELNNIILKARIAAMIEATKAEIIERTIDVTLAKLAVDEAQGTLTKDVNIWLSKVRDARFKLEHSEKRLKVAEDALEEYKSYVSLFVIPLKSSKK